MSGAKGVVLTFAALEEAGQAILLSQRVEAVAAAGEQLVRIALMSHIPDQLIGWRVEHRMQRDGELDHAESSANVPAGAGTVVDQERPHVGGQRPQLVARQPLQVSGRLHSVEDGHSQAPKMVFTAAAHLLDRAAGMAISVLVVRLACYD